MTAASDFFATRAAIREKFLKDAGWPNAVLQPIGTDAAFRRYFRLGEGSESTILLESVPPGHALKTPGHDLGDFVRIAEWLRGQGLHAPEIYAADVENGYLLLEDFGDTSFKIALNQGADAEKIYSLAIDVLGKLRAADAIGLSLPHYYASHVHTGRRRIIDWFLPAVRQTQNEADLVHNYLAVWDAIEKSLPPCPQGFLHIDYHVENLMLLPGGLDLARCGILDFQGAMIGPQPYDLANLLEDARYEIPDDLRAAMLDRFCADMPSADAATFRSWYRILATQFHCRVIGQFIRLAIRDGKPQYLQHLPRLAGYLERGLADPLLKPLRDWFAAQAIDFSHVPAIDPPTAEKFIRQDAF